METFEKLIDDEIFMFLNEKSTKNFFTKFRYLNISYELLLSGYCVLPMRDYLRESKEDVKNNMCI